MRIGIYGGTFDPIHLAHLVLAEQCLEQAALDEVWFIPAAQPPHKLGASISPPAQRLAMLEFAIAGHPRFRVDRVELERGGPSFTVDTLSLLQARHPADEWFLLLGADAIRDFPTWREPERILELARIVAVNRGGQPLPDLAPVQGGRAERVQVVEMPGLEISATDLRARVAAGRSIRFLVPRAVEVYIHQQALYRRATS
ncbi:MAG: nicotinate-nucleotide adenylyltransferase [Planctomycetaceae bacterium]|nr:nicotinate-nucleotide adenylyltransferase [Planctomycetaceae bacterium]